MKTCPQCHRKGVCVGSKTLKSLLKPAAQARIDDAAYRFCESPDCEVVYFPEENSSTFRKPELTVRVGIKETDAPRPVCYCFDHSIEEIESEVARTGTSTVLDDIRERMKDGCRCETTNPRGSCCLGTVSKAIRAAQARHGDSQPVGEAAGPQPDCCRRGRASAAGGRGLWASGGAVLTAMLSSTCCWLPLLLIAFGASGAAVASRLEPWRPWLLGVTGLFLAAGFFLAYRRRGPGIQRAMLWVAAAVALAFGFFPNYLGAFLDGNPVDSGIKPVEEQTVFQVEGMTCEGCASGLEMALGDVPGVEMARVDYESGQAVIGFAKEPHTTAKAVLKVIGRSGYTGRAERRKTGKDKLP